jgi:hypothetical protein
VSEGEKKSRSDLADQAESVGKAINVLRMDLIAAGYPFSAGTIRGAEESVLITFTQLQDTRVAETEL